MKLGALFYKAEVKSGQGMTEMFYEIADKLLMASKESEMEKKKQAITKKLHKEPKRFSRFSSCGI